MFLAAPNQVFSFNLGLQGGYDPIAGLGSNLLKVTTGLAALVFIIMLQAHHNHNPDSPHSGYITGVCHWQAVEVFDSVNFSTYHFASLDTKYELVALGAIFA